MLRISDHAISRFCERVLEEDSTKAETFANNVLYKEFVDTPLAAFINGTFIIPSFPDFVAVVRNSVIVTIRSRKPLTKQKGIKHEQLQH